MTSDIESHINDIQAKLEALAVASANARRDLVELRFKFISEDIDAWIKNGGCIACNGAGFARPWGAASSPADSIICPACDGNTPSYSLSFSSIKNPTNVYFPEIDYIIVECSRAVGLKINPPNFWTTARLEEKSRIEGRITELVREKAALEHAIVEAKSNAAKSASSASPSIDPSINLPHLFGVSSKQINYGVVCRHAAIKAGKASTEDLANITSAVHWIENFKHIAGTRR